MVFLCSTILQVDFYPEGRGYSGVFSGRDNYYPRDDYFYGGGYRYNGTSYQFISSLDLFFLGQFWQKQCVTNLPVFRAAAVSTSEDKIVSKSDAAQNSEERKSKNWSSWSLGERGCGKEKLTIAFTTTTWFLISTYSTLQPDLPLSISSSYSQRAGSMTSLREAPKRQFF